MDKQFVISVLQRLSEFHQIESNRLFIQVNSREEAKSLEEIFTANNWKYSRSVTGQSMTAGYREDQPILHFYRRSGQLWKIYKESYNFFLQETVPQGKYHLYTTKEFLRDFWKFAGKGNPIIPIR